MEANFSIIFTVLFHNEYSIFIGQELQRVKKAKLESGQTQEMLNNDTAGELHYKTAIKEHLQSMINLR